MKCKFALFLASMLPFVASCDSSGDPGSGKEPEKPAVTITATALPIVEGSSSTAITWKATDKIVVFDENGTSAEFSTETAGNPVVFTSEGYDAVPVYGAYPALSGSACSEGVLDVEIPAQQVETALVLVGKLSESTSSEYTLPMEHVTGFIKITLQEQGVKSIKVEGNAGETLAGPVAVDYAKLSDGTADFYTADENSSSSVTFSPDDLAPGSYYISLLPGTFRSGFKFTLTYDDDSTVERVIGEDGITVSRGTVTAIDEVLDDLLPETVAFTLNFWNAESVWPFNEAPADNRTADGESYTYGYTWSLDGEEKTRAFEFVLSQGSGENAEYSQTVLSGFTYPLLYFRTDNGFFKLPAVPGRHLKAVAMSHLNTANKRFRVQENSSSTATEAGKTYSSPQVASDGFEPVETSVIFPTESGDSGQAISPEAGKSYYVMLTMGSSLRMTTLRVYYTKSLDGEFDLPALGPWPEVPVSNVQNEMFDVVVGYGNETDNKGWH